jgi:Fe-S-cluster containining protein
MRIRSGLSALLQTDAERGDRIRKRAAEYIAAIAGSYPGSPISGELYDEEALPEAMNNAACPALDPDTGYCDLYAVRPLTCRTFGPATRIDENTYGACELCYVGASEDEIARCAVEFDTAGLEEELVSALEAAGRSGNTIVAYALILP